MSARLCLTCVLMLVAACAAGEGFDETGSIFTNSGGTTSNPTSMTMGNETTGSSQGDGDGDGAPGDGDGDPSTTDGPAVCGDGVKQGDEECDGNDLGGLDCVDFNFEDGTLVCASDCTLFTNACSTCGDGQLAATEACDGNNFGGLTCVDLGFASGTLSCSPDCTSVIQSGCMQAPNCGNGALDVGEACDGGNLNGQTCQSLGYDGGVLACTPGCLIDTSDCFVDQNQCVGILGACNILFDDCCDGLMCALAFCLPNSP